MWKYFLQVTNKPLALLILPPLMNALFPSLIQTLRYYWADSDHFTKNAFICIAAFIPVL